MLNVRNLSKLNPGISTRLLSSSPVIFEKAPPSSDTKPPNPTEPVQSEVPRSKLSEFDKKILVWTKKFKSVDEIPSQLSHEVLDRARTNFRIKVCNYMIVATLIGCGIMVYSGKQAAERGETVQRQNLEWHKKINDEAAVAHGENK